ncbi:MAG: hypothetical protein R3C03_07970 [Pirellulaceae bacterium]
MTTGDPNSRYELAISNRDVGLAWNVRFSRNGDAFEHAVHIGEQSVGHNPNNRQLDWLTSLAAMHAPALQQLHEQEISGRPVIMGVGMSGTCHWSACVACDPKQTSKLVFEWAVRSKNLFDRKLASSYRLAKALEIDVIGRESVRICDSLGLVLDLQAMNAGFEWMPNCQRLDVQPIWPQRPGIQTVTWSYSIQLSRIENQ